MSDFFTAFGLCSPVFPDFRRAMIRTIATVVATINLAACTVGPDYAAPQPGLPSEWHEGTPGASAGLHEWWRQFHDPVLDELVAQATAQNLGLKSAVSRVRQARAQFGEVDLASDPVVNAGANYRRSGSGSSSGSSAYGASLDAAWEVDLFGGNRRSVEAADADLQAACADLGSATITLQAEVVIDYITLRTNQRQLALARENIALQAKSADIVRRRQAGGFLPPLDAVNAEAQLASAQTPIPALESNIRQSIYAIALLLSASPDALLQRLDPPATLPPPPEGVPLSLPSELLRRRPDIRRAEAQLHAATARIGVATADLFPQLSITGSVGTRGGEPVDLLSLPNRFWSIGPSLSVPIFNTDRLRFNIEVRNAQEEQARLNYESTVLAAIKEVECALVALRKEHEHLALLQISAAASLRAESMATRLYEGGQTDYLNVISAQRARLSADTALVQSRQALAANWVTLAKAMGGGWGEPSPR